MIGFYFNDLQTDMHMTCRLASLLTNVYIENKVITPDSQSRIITSTIKK